MASLLFAPACDTDDGGAGEPTEITLQFAGMVGAQDFTCGESYEGLGKDGTALTVNDFRLYLSNIRLVDSEGEEVPLALEQDGKWQVDDVVLLDFEDGCGDMGNADLNGLVRGTAPLRDYTGVRFDLGVPFELNHANAATAPAPLNVTSMFWNWQGGYKFMRVDSSSLMMASGWRFHLGSTGCDGDAQSGGVTECAAANRPAVELEGYDFASDVIAVDLAALVRDADLERSDMGMPDGCMASPSDEACMPYFDNLGLDFGDMSAGEQVVFQVK